jgi:hypothetical protein
MFDFGKANSTVVDLHQFSKLVDIFEEPLTLPDSNSILDELLAIHRAEYHRIAYLLVLGQWDF